MILIFIVGVVGVGVELIAGLAVGEAEVELDGELAVVGSGDAVLFPT